MNTFYPDNFKQQLAKCEPPIATASSLPPCSYADPEILRLEKQQIFEKSWLGVGRSDQWKQAGDYSAIEITGIPIIVLRDSDGQLRAYANSCRHRGAKLLEGNGTCQVIRCPFHRWTYALDGQLLTAPQIKRSEQFDYNEYGLIEIQASERLGFAFISFNQKINSIDDWLGDFNILHAPWTFDELRSYKRHEFEVQCNWKAFLEVFNEYYHLPYVHPNSINSVYESPESPETVSGQYATQFGATEGTGALLESTQEHALPKIASLTGSNASGVRYSWVFPNLTFAAGMESIWIYEAYPLTPNNSKIALTLCFPQTTFEVKDFNTHAQVYFDRLIAAIGEDIPALENQQRGLSSPLAQPGRFCEALEPNVAQFAFWYAKQFQ